MMRRKFFLPLFSCIVIFSCRNPNQKIIENAPYLSITITDGLNRKITFKENPKRIISLAPNITEMFYAVGAENSLIGISHACDYPPQTDKKKRFQTYPTLDYEGIITEKPDCIITTTEVMGGIQSLSRSTYAKMLPETEDHASYFSFYDVTEKIAIVLGTFSFGLIEEITGSMRNSTLALMIFFILGLLILTRVRMKRQ